MTIKSHFTLKDFWNARIWIFGSKTLLYQKKESQWELFERRFLLWRFFELIVWALLEKQKWVSNWIPEWRNISLLLHSGANFMTTGTQLHLLFIKFSWKNIRIIRASERQGGQGGQFFPPCPPLFQKFSLSTAGFCLQIFISFFFLIIIVIINQYLYILTKISLNLLIVE